MLRRLPEGVLDLLLSIITGLFTRLNHAADGAEPYAYEDQSRFLWRSYGGQPPTPGAGIPGAQFLGPNIVQQIWTAMNMAEDNNIREEVQWEGFKLSASPHAPKGIKKLDQKDNQRRKAEEERRRIARERYFYTRAGIIDPIKDVPEEPAALRGIVPKTDDDLVQEMHNWVTGKDDWHDEIVSNYKVRVQEQQTQLKLERQERLAAIRQHDVIRQDALMPTTNLTGYTMEQLQMVLAMRGHAGTGGVRHVTLGEPAQERVYQKFLEGGDKETSGMLQAQGGRIQVDGDKDGSLNRQLMDRLVRMQTGSEDG